VSTVGTILTLTLIGGLILLVRDKDGVTSKALWIPTLWFWIVFSRPFTMWLHVQRNVTQAGQFTEASPIDAAFYGALIIAAAVVLNRRGTQFRNFLQLNFPIVLFFFYYTLSVAWADEPSVAVKRCFKAAGEVLVILVLITDPHPTLALKRVFTRVGFSLILLSALFIFFVPSMGTTFDPITRKTYYIGVCTWKNQLGLLCMVCGLTSLWQFLDAWGTGTIRQRIRIMLPHAAIFALAVRLTKKADAMTAYSCLALASAVLVLASLKWARRQRGAVFMLVAGTVGIALFAVFLDSAGTLLQSIGRNSTLTGRTQIWSAVLSQHINPLLGTGFESFWMGSRMQSVWDQSQQGIDESHNGYIEMYVNLGLIGLALLLLLIINGYRHAMQLFRRDPRTGRLALAFFTGSLIFSLSEAGFRMLTPIWIAFLLSIMSVTPAETSTMETHIPMRIGAARSQARILQ